MNKLFILLSALLVVIIMGCGGSGGTDPAPAPLSSAKAITAYNLAGTAGVINEGAKTIAVAKPYGTDVTALVATFTTTGASVKVGSTIQVSGTTANDFTASVAYTVTAADGTSVIYTVTVTIAAPLGSLPKTTQTVCYNTAGTVIACAGTGQDGELQKGVAWPSPRFTDNGDQTITDNLTGLMWTKDANAPGPVLCTPGVSKTWQQGLDYAACLNANSYLGHNDWRLPNVNEMGSLVNYSQSNPATWLNAQGFSNVQTALAYVSSTTIPPMLLDAYSVTMKIGYIDDYDNKLGTLWSVWPVRTGQSGTVNLPKTGQTICYDSIGTVIACAGTGQDGDLQKGVAWPSPRFIDNGDQTITDNLTGLMWTKDANAPGPVLCTPGVSKTWQQGLDYAACLNANSYLGHNDWRLPNVNELKSLVDFGSTTAGLLWLNTQGFSNVQIIYFSSTTLVGSQPSGSTDNAWMALLDIGVDPYLKTGSPIYAWPVRGGQ